MTTRAAVFPGQGSQAVGMGRSAAEAYPAARAVFEEVDAALGEPLSELVWGGPIETLTLTQNAQPALMAASLAVIRALEAEGADLGAQFAYVAGHSLGEYSALAAAGALSVGDAARLLRLRGEAMQAATPPGVGAMAAVLGLEMDAAEALAAKAAAAAAEDGLEDPVCEIANDNAPGQIVLSGHKAAIDHAVALAKAAGAKRALPLAVSAPFHCRLMAPAAEAMAAALAEAEIRPPSLPVVANVKAAPVSDPDEIRRLLVEQVAGSVRWRDCVTWLAGAGVTEMVEFGSGKVLTGLAKRISSAVTAEAVESGGEIAALAARLRAAG